MAKRLGPNEIVTIRTLIEKRHSNVEIARLLDITEGAVRYQRAKLGHPPKVDGRKGKTTKLHGFENALRAWVETHCGAPPKEPVNVLALYDHLRYEHSYPASYKSVLRYTRKHFPVPTGRPKRRVETPPGAQCQTDWTEMGEFCIGGCLKKMSLLVMTLSYSRYSVAVWATDEAQLSWQRSHNEAYKRIGGVAAVNRIDNLPTGVASGAGHNAKINEAFRAYARAVRFHPDPTQAYSPEQKGKVERKNQAIKKRFDPGWHDFDTVEDLQVLTDRRLLDQSQQTLCPATGKSVYDTWLDELPLLGPLPILPEPFDTAVERKVTEDCLVQFEGRSYRVPYRYWRQRVEVRGCALTVQIVADGKVIREYPRKTQERLLLHPEDYDEDPEAGCPRPLPLGRMGTRLQEIYEMPVEARPIDLYAALAEVAR